MWLKHSDGCSGHSDQRGISQDPLADLGDFDRTYPSLLECGLRTPTLSVLLRLAEALTIEPAQLVTETVGRLRGESATTRRRVYRLAHLEPSGEFTHVGRACLSLEDACRRASRQNDLRREFNLPAFTHAAIYEAIAGIALTAQPPK